VQVAPTVSAVAVQGSSFAGCAKDDIPLNRNEKRQIITESILFI
jgi:tRNA U55 pseudouridine synthase TruB